MGIWKKGPSVILAGSGMCNGGRILNHLRIGLSNPKNAVCIVGFQAEETLGRELVEGAKNVLIDEKPVKVKAKINTFFGFSAHADNIDLLNFIGRFDKQKLKKVFLTHAEPSRSEAFRDEIVSKGYDAKIPTWKETVEL